MLPPGSGAELVLPLRVPLPVRDRPSNLAAGAQDKQEGDALSIRGDAGLEQRRGRFAEGGEKRGRSQVEHTPRHHAGESENGVLRKKKFPPFLQYI